MHHRGFIHRELVMNAATVLLVLVAGLTNGQLNFEGNPLTEDTEYTAEESRVSERTAKVEETTANVTNNLVQSSQNLYPPYSNVNNSSVLTNPLKTTIDAYPTSQEDSSYLIEQQKIVHTARNLPTSSYNQGTTSVNTAELALNSFLNSKTPEESRLSLDHYLENRDSPAGGNVQGTIVNQQQFTQQPVQPVVNQQIVSSPVNQHLTAQLMQQRHPFQAFHVNQPGYNAPTNPIDLRSTMANPMTTPLMQQQQLFQPYTDGIQSRKDVYYPGWYQRVRRVRGKPFNYAQSRGGPGFHSGPPIPVPFKPKGPPVEVIYTKPPGFHHGPPAINNPPVRYEDTSAWFPEADQPPPTKDVYYSQLYAQSYDPYYYNYIAQTGKIKPHLYGKFGKYRDEEGGGIWAELYKGFKKHGLKNIMTPTFLLGMTLPVVTLMLTALVQKRSLSRSDSREFPQEDTIQEYLEQIQRAVNCYEKRRRKRDANVIDEC